VDFCRYSKSGPKSGKYFRKVGKLKVVPRVTVRGMRVPKSIGDVKDFSEINEFIHIRNSYLYEFIYLKCKKYMNSY
jgi:hypothetical protein